MSQTARYELKFILDEGAYTDALRWLHTTVGARRSYPGRFINSVYFDDPDFNAVKDNLAGISDRKKFRLRWYDTDQVPSGFRLEAKIREGRLGFKRLFDLPPVPGGIREATFGAVTDHIKAQSGDDPTALELFSTHASPALHVRYHRDYFEAALNLRFTIDSQITYGLPVPSKPIAEALSVPYPHRLLEVKFPPSDKDRVSRLLGELHLTPKRHSKYLMGLAMHGLVTYI